VFRGRSQQNGAGLNFADSLGGYNLSGQGIREFAEPRTISALTATAWIRQRMPLIAFWKQRVCRKVSVALASQMESGRPKVIRSLRWWIGGILFASTVINYVDRQTLSILAPYLKQDYHWSNVDYANIAIAFRVAYSVGQTICGRLMDRVGTRRGLTIGVMWYSIVSVLTSVANGFGSFAVFRFLLGAGESANWPGASKAVSECFQSVSVGWPPPFTIVVRQSVERSRPFLFCPCTFALDGERPRDSRTARILVADCVAPVILPSAGTSAHWRRRARDDPSETQGADAAESAPLPWRQLLKLPQTWGTILSKALTDPVWFFVTDWFPIYLVAKGISLKSGLIAVWIPFLAADLGISSGAVLPGT